MKTPFTPLEHIGAGDLLNRIRADLVLLEHAAYAAYGKRVSGRVAAAEKAIGRLRNHLDGLVCNEHPMSVQDLHGVGITKIYYASAATDARDNPREALAEQGRHMLKSGEACS